MSHPGVRDFNRRLKKVFDRVDDYLEEKYGGKYPLHPSRPRRGVTSNKAQDGLFNIGASFTAGYGSDLGRGYVVDVDMVTLAHIPSDVRRQIEEDAIAAVEAYLREEFPDRELHVSKDRHTFKIHGDLSLGTT
ncbi:MAG: hypothetical protein ACOCYG_02435 [Spirochaetota bacterium]